ncbi:uncharacterized protein EDB91DRAFT_1083583 [Suillus paluster]|uniref:uncharacterized protein n=1 Tax=Suillus paluster TaxID=48578 RepID=UPI001B86FCE8|nr:uncharacterized protein EDB91DRAFT_1083583 [Suillus paluster]KAG1735665.1 hypothetical protein EDB91DRAFT_1083583 [Suillus paluster]
MDDETITQAVSAKQVTREKLRLHLLMTAWEIEEIECHKRLLGLLQQKNAQEYVEASNEAHVFERFMTHHDTSQLEDDFDFGVGTYKEELLAFGISEEQLNQLEAFAVNHNLHDPNQTITKDKYSTDPFTNSAESDNEDRICYDDDEDNDLHFRGETPEWAEFLNVKSPCQKLGPTEWVSKVKCLSWKQVPSDQLFQLTLSMPPKKELKGKRKLKVQY